MDTIIITGIFTLSGMLIGAGATLSRPRLTIMLDEKTKYCCDCPLGLKHIGLLKMNMFMNLRIIWGKVKVQLNQNSENV